jgi:hypothetical protein
MDSSRLSERVGVGRVDVLGVAAVAFALAMGGCSADYVDNSRASVLFQVADINGGAVMDSDVRLGENSTLICPDFVDVSVAVREKNPNTDVPSIPNAVVVSRYEVRFTRPDGRGAEGVDVPYSIVGSLTTVVDVATSGAVTFPIEVVRRQAKLEPPLSTIAGYDIVTMFAEITIYGETISGEGVSSTGRLQIDFADYGDTESSCPTQG